MEEEINFLSPWRPFDFPRVRFRFSSMCYFDFLRFVDAGQIRPEHLL